MRKVFSLETLNDVMRKAAGRGEHTALLWQDGTGSWQPISSNELLTRVRAFAAVLEGWGIGKGDRIALLSENRWEWAVTDFAALAIGAVDVPLYATLPADQIAYMLRDSGARVAVVSTREQFEKIAGSKDLPELQHLVVMDEDVPEGGESFHALMASAQAGLDPDPGAFWDRLRAVGPDDLATIIYTSGTTGEPKGVMLTHGNVASNINYSTGELEFSERDSCISFLPLSHVTARHLDYALMSHGTTLAYCPQFDRLPEAMKAVRPTVFVAVPRVYEKIRQAVEGKAAASKIRSRLLRWAVSAGRRQQGEIAAGRTPRSISWKLADRLVFGKVRGAFGGRVHTFLAGGAPLGKDTAGWFLSVGIRIFEGYGLTETSPVIALNYPGSYRMGTVGKPLPNVEHRFAPDGELEVRGPSVFRGYWKNDKETTAAFTGDGWFRTGDIGELDSQGNLTITDRKKELLKTSGGKLIAPQPIENRLKANSLVAYAALVGDTHKFASVLLSPNFPALESWAAGNGVPAGDRGALVANDRVKQLYQGVVDEVNRGLAHHETIKRMHVVGEEWTIENGELTPSMKLKRRVITSKYKGEIEDFYRDEATAHG